MKISTLLLVAVILIAGCIQSGMAPIVKNLPEVKEFLNQYPEAAITASAYSPASIKFVLKNFEEQCPNLGEEGKSYQKVTVIDGKTKQMMIVWVEAKNNEFVCAIRTSLSGEIVTTTSSTTTIPPTTTAQITTTSQATTTTLLPTTTTTIANTTNTTNASATSSTTTTIGPTPDLFISDINITKAVYYVDFWDPRIFSHNISFRVTNIGNAISNATLARITILNESASNASVTTNLSSVKALAPGESVLVDFRGPYRLTRSTYAQAMYYLSTAVDLSDQFSFYNNTESNEENNLKTIAFPVPYIFPTQANLVVSYISFSFGNTSIRVKNIGTEPSDAFSVSINQYSSNNQSAGGCGNSFPALAPGLTNQTWCWTAGAAKANATADTYNMTIETNENDNVNSTFS